LKAALDSKKTRKICWNTDSYKLRNEGVPDTFNFEGSAIFITNIKFENVKSKKLQDHLQAVQSRCHYLDLTLDNNRDKLLRIKQIARTGALYQDYDFTDVEMEEQLEFIEHNQDNLNELSLRMALKIADLRNVSNSNWREMAEVTCMKRR
jgi:hypothetical protein